MFSNQSVDISLNGPCRALDSIRGDAIESRFLVGSCSVNSNNGHIGPGNFFHNANTSVTRFDSGAGGSGSNNNDGTNSSSTKNCLTVLGFYTDTNELSIEAEFDHFIGPVHSIRCHPSDPSLVITTTTSPKQSNAATLWRLPRQLSSTTTSRSEEQSDDPSGYESQVYSTGTTRNSDIDKTDHGLLERIATLHHPDDEQPDGYCNSVITHVSWRAGGEESSGDVLTIDTLGNLTQWDVSFGAADPIKRVSMAAKVNSNNDVKKYNTTIPQPRVMWDPHSNSGDTLAVSYGASVRILDWRMDTSIPTGTVDSLSYCHRYGVTDIDYNPNKPYVMATSGKDGLLKFWDLRSTKQYPLLTARGGHSHWISNVQYNPFHDQLLLSTGTDSIVNLWRFSTISSAPVLAYDEDEDFGGNPATATTSVMGHSNSNNGKTNNNPTTSRSSSSAPNARVDGHEHGDSVHAAAWGAADAWIYLTVGYDGKAILSHVPSKEKYKILL